MWIGQASIFCQNCNRKLTNFLCFRLVEKLQETSPDQVDIFKTNMNKVMKDILGRFKELQFFTGESMDVDGMVGLLEYRDVGDSQVRSYFLVTTQEVLLALLGRKLWVMANDLPRMIKALNNDLKTVHQVAETGVAHDRPVDANMASREHYLQYGVRIVDWTI